MSSALSAGSSACDHLYNWVNGTPKDTWVSMGVFSDGSYGASQVRVWATAQLVVLPGPCLLAATRPVHPVPQVTRLVGMLI